MKIAICDDDKSQQNELVNMINTLLADEDIEIKKYFCGEELVKAYEVNERYNIILLDMQMKALDGIETAKYIRNYDERCIIIVITSIMEYAMKGYRINAFDFILKPVKINQFENVLKKAVEKVNSTKNNSYTIESREKKVVLKISDIYYIESYKRKVNVYCKDDIYEKNNNITNEEKDLTRYGFIRISRFFLVNMAYIKEIHNTHLLLQNGTRLKIGFKLKQQVYDAYTDFMMEEM